MTTPAASIPRTFYGGQLVTSVLGGLAASVVTWNLRGDLWSHAFDQYFPYAVYIGYLLGEMSMAAVWLVFGAGRVRTRVAATGAWIALVTGLFFIMPIAQPTAVLPLLELFYILTMSAGVLVLLGPPLLWLRLRGGRRLVWSPAGEELPPADAINDRRLQFGLRHLFYGMTAVAVMTAALSAAAAHRDFAGLLSAQLTRMFAIYVVFAAPAAGAIAWATLAPRGKLARLLVALFCLLLCFAESFVWQSELRLKLVDFGFSLMLPLIGFLALVLIAHCLTTRWAGYRLVRNL